MTFTFPALNHVYSIFCSQMLKVSSWFDLPIYFSVNCRDILRMDGYVGADSQQSKTPRRLTDLAAYALIGERGEIMPWDICCKMGMHIPTTVLSNVPENSYISYHLSFKISTFAHDCVHMSSFPNHDEAITFRRQEFELPCTHGGLPPAKLVMLTWSREHGIAGGTPGEKTTFFECISNCVPPSSCIYKILLFALNCCPETAHLREHNNTNFLCFGQAVRRGIVGASAYYEHARTGIIPQAPIYTVKNGKVTFDFEQGIELEMAKKDKKQFFRVENFLRKKAKEFFEDFTKGKYSIDPERKCNDQNNLS